MNRYSTLSLLPIVALISSCATPYYKSNDLTSPTQIVSRDAAVAIGLVQQGPSGYQYCFQSAPDAAFSQSGNLSFDFSLINIGNTVRNEGDTNSENSNSENSTSSERTSESESSTETEMVGRTPALLFAREIFYRTCETALSTNANPDDWRAMFKLTLEIAAEVMKEESKKTSVTIIENVKGSSNKQSSTDLDNDDTSDNENN